MAIYQLFVKFSSPFYNLNRRWRPESNENGSTNTLGQANYHIKIG